MQATMHAAVAARRVAAHQTSLRCRERASAAAALASTAGNVARPASVASARPSSIAARQPRRRLHSTVLAWTDEPTPSAGDAAASASSSAGSGSAIPVPDGAIPVSASAATAAGGPAPATDAAAPVVAAVAATAAPVINTRDLKPSELVTELDRFIIGQADAKKAVAIALRNRWRRHRLPPELRHEVTPKNLLLIGPTGCGKTEIARRLARLTQSPFIKVEATKFTEVGFHGRDVDSIVQDLVRVAIAAAKTRRKTEARAAIKKKVSDKLLAALTSDDAGSETFRESLEAGQLETIEVEVEVPVRVADDDEETSGGQRAATAAKRLSDMLRGSRAGKTELRKLTISEARPLLEEAEMDELISPEEYTKEALQSVQDDGIVFIDEIDKIASSGGSRHSADASAEGVQRDLLPLLEGTTVTTKQGEVSTEHILFICSGAFHSAKPSDLLAELQGRLPIRVELVALTEDDLYRVLAETENSLVQQQTALLEVDQVNLVWTDEALREIAKVSAEVNRSVENIGARRLNTVIEKIVDEISYAAADDPPGTEYVIDKLFVRSKVGELLKTTDLGKFIL